MATTSLASFVYGEAAAQSFTISPSSSTGNTVLVADGAIARNADDQVRNLTYTVTGANQITIQYEWFAALTGSYTGNSGIHTKLFYFNGSSWIEIYSNRAAAASLSGRFNAWQSETYVFTIPSPSIGVRYLRASIIDLANSSDSLNQNFGCGTCGTVSASDRHFDNADVSFSIGPSDSTPPTLTIAGPVTTQTSPFTVNFNFSESVVGFTSGDVVVTNGTLSGFTGSGASYSATITPTGDGLVSLNVAAATYEDAAGNDNTAASSFSVQADISLPTASVAGPAGPVNAPFTANFAFSENVSNFALGDITVVNGTASAFAGSGANYSATITPTTNGPVQVSLANGVANDAAGNGNQISNTFSVIADLTAPVVTVPGNISVVTDSGLNTAVVTYSVSASDPGNGALTPVLTAGLASGSPFPLGTTLVTYQATDAAGNVSSASFNVTVTDDESPTLVGMPGNIATDTDAGLATAVVTWTPPTVSDNVAGATVTQTAGLVPGSVFPLGVTTVTYEAEDAAGNISTASFTVTVSDNENPIVVGLPANIVVSTDPGLATALVGWTEPTPDDNAPGSTITRTAGPAPGSAFPIGVTTITYEAEDGAGNTAQASFTVTVQDNEDPSILGLPADIVVSTDPGVATALVSWTEPTPDDNAPGSTITRTAGPAPGSAFPIGVTTITYEVEDGAGNTTQASFTVTVEDNEDPVIGNLPAAIAVSTDAGQATAVVNWTAPTVTDNAPGATITQTAGPAPGSAFPIGVTTITYEAEDAAGNTTQASFTITVEDNEAPVILSLPADIAVDTDAGQATAVVTWSAPTVTDNAPGATISQTAGPASGSSFPIGVTTITYEAEDSAGNTVSESFTVTVTDGEPPAFTSFPDNIAITVDYPTTSAVASWSEPSVTDNAPGASVSRIAGPASGSTFPLGVTTITYRVQDGGGNVVDQSFTVTVSQTPPGTVRLVIQSGEDGAFAFNSPEPDLNFTINTANGDGEQSVAIRPGVFNLAFTLPAGFGVLSAECNDGNSTLSGDAQTGTINLASGEDITCTIVTVDSLNETSRLIGALIGARAQLIMQNMPDADRRIDRLNGRASTASGVSAFGLSMGRGDLPFALSLGEDRANFSFSLSSMRAQRARNREEARIARAGWGDGRYDDGGRRPLSQGYDFAGFGAYDAANSAGLDQAAIAAGIRDGSIGTASASGEDEPRANANDDAVNNLISQRFDVWVEGAYAQFDTEIGDGDFYMLSIGADWITTPDLLLGLAAQVDWTDMNGTIADSSIEGVGVLVGPYMTARLGERLYFDAHAALGRSSNQVSPFGVYEDEVDANRAYLSAALIGDLTNGGWTFRPEGRISYFREETEAYVDSLNVAIPSLEVETGTISFSPTLSYRYQFADQSTLEPFVSMDATWIFRQENAAEFALGNSPFTDQGLRGRVETGLDFVQAGGMNLRVTGFYDGIGEDEFTSWGGQLRLSWSFDPE